MMRRRLSKITVDITLFCPILHQVPCCAASKYHHHAWNNNIEAATCTTTTTTTTTTQTHKQSEQTKL